jgi:hypothetical protein
VLDRALGGDREGPLAAEQSPSPSRSSSARSLSPPVYTPTIRRRPPHLGQRRTSSAKTRLRRADHERPGERDGAGDEPATAIATSLDMAAVAS